MNYSAATITMISFINTMAQLYFHGQGIIPLGPFGPRNTTESSQVFGFLVALFSLEVVTS